MAYIHGYKYFTRLAENCYSKISKYHTSGNAVWWTYICPVLKHKQKIISLTVREQNSVWH